MALFRSVHCFQPVAASLRASLPPGGVLITAQIPYVVLRPLSPLVENAVEKEFQSLVGSCTVRHGLFAFNLLGNWKLNLSFLFEISPLAVELPPWPQTLFFFVCRVVFVLRHLLCLLSSMDTDVTCRAELSELWGVFFSSR